MKREMAQVGALSETLIRQDTGYVWVAFETICVENENGDE